MERSTKILLGVGALGLGVGAYVFYPKKAHAGTPGPGPGGGMAPVTKDSDADLIKACADGTKAGGTDGSKDGAGSGVKSPMPVSNYSDKKAVQAKFEECYGLAYANLFASAKAAADALKKGTETGPGAVPYGTGPSAAEKSTAFSAGKDAGKAQAKLDSTYVIDYSRVPAGYRTEPSDPVLRENWRAGYNEGYGTTWVSPGTEPYGSGGGGEEDDSGVFGESPYVRVGGRLVPRARTSGGTRVGAMYVRSESGAPMSYTYASSQREYDAGFARGCADARKAVESGAPMSATPISPGAHSSAWSDGYMAGWKKCFVLKPGVPIVIQPVNKQSNQAMRALSYASKPVIAPFKFLGGMVHGIVSGVIR